MCRRETAGHVLINHPQNAALNWTTAPPTGSHSFINLLHFLLGKHIIHQLCTLRYILTVCRPGAEKCFYTAVGFFDQFGWFDRMRSNGGRSHDPSDGRVQMSCERLE